MTMNFVQHIGFNCVDIKKQEAFYRKHFGFKRAKVFNPGPDQFVMLRLGQICLELFGGGDAAAPRGEQKVGFKHLAFEVPDIEKAAAGLKADGFEVGDLIDCSGFIPNMRVCFFKDPEGNILELMQGFQDDPIAESLPR
jgi:glyoxylase I family protein